MDTLDLADTTVRYEVRGEGDPVVLLHANPFVDWYLPVIERMPHYSFVRYTRLPRDDTMLSMARDAATCAQLAEHLGWGRARVVGHSAGALAALQLAVDAPDLVLAKRSGFTLSPGRSSDIAPGDGRSGSLYRKGLTLASRRRRCRVRSRRWRGW